MFGRLISKSVLLLSAAVIAGSIARGWVGTSLAQPEPRAGALRDQDDARFKPNFRNSVLAQVTQIFARTAGREVETLDPKFRGLTVTYTSDRSLTRAELWQTYLTILDSLGLTASEHDGVWRVEAKPAAPQN